MDRHPDDPLRVSGQVLCGIILVTALVLATMLMGLSIRRTGAETAAHFIMRTAALSDLSLVPSGNPLRYPSLHHPAIDLRHTPFLPVVDPDVAGMLLDADIPGHGRRPK